MIFTSNEESQFFTKSEYKFILENEEINKFAGSLNVILFEGKKEMQTSKRYSLKGGTDIVLT